MRDIEKLWNSYESFIKRLSDDNLNKLVDELGQKIAECTVSLKSNDPYCGPGGLVEMMLDTANNARKLSSALDLNVTIKSILLVSLTSEIGRIGTKDQDMIIDQESDWHREKLNQYYKYNDKCPKISVPHQSLQYLQEYGVKLSWDEWMAVLLSGGPHREENKMYAQDTPSLAYIIQSAKYAAYESKKAKKEPDPIPF